MIGLSLQYKWLLGNGSFPMPERTAFLTELRRQGVGSIELRSIPSGGAPNDALRAAELLWDHGFRITVHGSVKTAEHAVAEVLDPLSEILSHLRQRELIVTVHPIVGDNVAMLRTLSDRIIEKGYPLRIALENERRLPDKSEGDSLSLVLDSVERVDRANVGICFDMGHFAWYVAQGLGYPDGMPPKKFLERVIHTHIHAYAEGQTHFPLENWAEPVSAYVQALDRDYFGIYNLELEPPRFAHRMSAEAGYLCSVDTLRKNFPFSASLYEKLRLHYDGQFKQALGVLEQTEGSYASLIGPSSYLFSTNGFRWAMDPAFRNARYLAESPSRVREYLGGLDLILVTHNHEDHLEESTVRALADTEIRWVVPDFLTDRMSSFGVGREKLIPVSVGETVRVGPLTVRVLEGRHFRPDTGKGIEAVGYVVSAEDAPTLVFPGDVRDYRTDGMEPIEGDVCFGHVWLSDCAKDPQRYLPKCEEFAEFMLMGSRRRILLTHLYESGRSENGMWQTHHAEAARTAILARSPETAVEIPTCGEILKLS